MYLTITPSARRTCRLQSLFYGHFTFSFSHFTFSFSRLEDITEQSNLTSTSNHSTFWKPFLLSQKAKFVSQQEILSTLGYLEVLFADNYQPSLNRCFKSTSSFRSYISLILEWLTFWSETIFYHITLVRCLHFFNCLYNEIPCFKKCLYIWNRILLT